MVNANTSSPRLATSTSRSWSHRHPLHFGPTDCHQLCPFPSYQLLELSIDEPFNHIYHRRSNSSIRRLTSLPSYKNGVIPPASLQWFLSHRKLSSWTLPKPPWWLGSSRHHHSSKKSFHQPPPSLFCYRWAHNKIVQPFQSVAVTDGAEVGHTHTASEWRCQVHLWSMVDERYFCPWLNERSSQKRFSVLFK
jgi:hypothetical protein